MHFRLIDRVLEHTESRAVATKLVSMSEEYLQDHFPTFPVLPGVFMVEALVQTARELDQPDVSRLVLGRVRALKYGSFVRPGDVMTTEIRLMNRLEDGSLDVKGKATVRPASGEGDEAIACSGRFMLRPLRLSVGGSVATPSDQIQTEPALGR